MKLPIKKITNLIIGAWNRKDEDRAWSLYVSTYQNMTSDTFMTFDEFYNPKKAQKQDNRSAEEILEEVKGILEMRR